MPGTRSVFAERAAGGYFVDFVPNREAMARYGLTVDDVQSVIMSAIGGETIATTIEGRERYTINLRYPRDLRADLDQLERVLVTTSSGAQIPIRQVADLRLTTGPAMIRDENGMLAGYVYVDITGRDVGSYVTEAKQLVTRELKLPTGYSLVWSGQYENMMRVRERLKIVIPVTLVLIFILLYMNTKSAFKTFVVMLAVPFSLVGAVWLLYLLDYNISIAVWVGMIALMGLDAETGVFMLLFLDLSYDDAKREGRLRNQDRPARSDHPRRRETHPAEDDDRRRGHHGPDADHVVHRHRRGPDEARRRADGRRPVHLFPHGTAGVSRDLLPLAHDGNSVP